MAPTAELRQAIRAEFEALYGRWKQEVLYEAGTYRRAMQRQYEALGTLVHQEHFTAEDPETARVMGEALAGFIPMIYTLEPKAPSPEEATDRPTDRRACGRAPDAPRGARVETATAWRAQAPGRNRQPDAALDTRTFSMR